MFEKVNPSHPDKVADRIAGAIVDLCYTKNKDPKVACEVLIGHGQASIQQSFPFVCLLNISQHSRMRVTS